MEETVRQKYDPYLQFSFTPSPSANGILRFLWENMPPDPSAVKSLMVASVGVPNTAQDREKIRELYDEIARNLCPGGIPALTDSISVFHRILRHEAELRTHLFQEEAVAYDTRRLAHIVPTPRFIFFVRLRHRHGFQAFGTTKKYFEHWMPWFAPQIDLGFAFTKGNWGTLSLFRDVLDALLGRHLVPHSPLAIFRDPDCTEEAKDTEPLAGSFYVEITVSNLEEIEVFKMSTPAPERDSQFAKGVHLQCGHVCAFSPAPYPETDLEAAHILPRGLFRVFR
ncbi:hypothetical protein B0H19DRAFT_557868 [Mycena capillaripes]|nr:hypothetical protein B0H19DRAFT_557868 [Mycena capillaripes]